jgi:MFS family permease
MITAPPYRYTIAGACFMIQAIGIGTYVSYGVFFTPLADEFQWPRAVISGASSFAFITSGAFAILIGRLLDRYGPRQLMSIAAVLLGIGCMAMSRVQEIWQLYCVFGIIFGIGLGAVDVIALTTTARWFVRSRGLVTGIVKVGTGAGQFFIPFLAGVLIALYGWRTTYLIIGSSVLVLLLLIAQVLRRDPASAASPRHPDASAATAAPGPAPTGIDAAAAMRTPQMLIICSASVSTVFCLLVILVHIVPHAGDIGLSTTHAAGVLSTIGAISMLGRFCSGVAIDRIGSKTVLIICYFVLTASLLWLQAADSLWMLYCFAGIYGLAHGSFFTAISPLVAEIFGITAHGALFGVVVFAGTVGGAIGPIVAGRIFDLTGSYAAVFITITVLSVISLGLILLLKPLAGPRAPEKL